MEQSEDFKRIVSNIKKLEQKLLLIDERAKINEGYGKEAEREIEEHFEKCFLALASRKESLMRELYLELTKQRKSTEEAIQQVNQAIGVQRKVLEAGSQLFATDAITAEHIWQGATNLPLPQTVISRIKLELPSSLLQPIQMHGRVSTVSRQVSGVFENTAAKLPDDVITFAGAGRGFVDGKGEQAKFNLPHGICWNPKDDCMYLCDKGNNAIRKITLQGEVRTFVRSSEGELAGPHGIAYHINSSSFFVTNQRAHTIVKVSSSGSISIFAGSAEKSGYEDGIGTKALFHNPTGITIDQQTGILYVSDAHNFAIRKITPEGQVTTLARSPEREISPWGILFDETEQSLLVCDHDNHKLRRVSLQGEITTVCGIPSPAFAIRANNTIFVSSFYDFKIFKVTRQDTMWSADVSVLEPPKEKEKTEEWKFYKPTGLLFHPPSHTFYVVEASAVTPTIRKIFFSS